MRKMILNNRTPQFIGRVRMASDPTMKIRGGGNPIANHGINAGQKSLLQNSGKFFSGYSLLV